MRTFGEQFVIPEAPIDVAPEDNPTNEPEPDLVVLAKPSREFQDANPRFGDLRLVVEISDSTLGFDLTTKAELYVRAGIVEYWVVDVAARRLVVHLERPHRDPREGLYRCHSLRRRGNHQSVGITAMRIPSYRRLRCLVNRAVV